MILERKDGTKIKLTCDEVSRVHRHFVTEWMKSVAKEILDGCDDGIQVTKEDLTDIAEIAFELSCLLCNFKNFNSINPVPARN